MQISHAWKILNRSLTIFLLIVGLIYLSTLWPVIARWCFSKQLLIHHYLVTYLMELRLHLYWLLLGSFLYGVFHAAGPGHGKFVVMSWLSTHPENQHTARVIPFIGSLMQGVTAILFVYVLAICLKLTTGDLSLSRWYIDNLSAGFIAVFGVYVMKQAYRSMQPKQLKINAVLPTTHVHSEHCGCHHLPTHEIKSSDSWRTRLGIVFSIGMRPCSGAIMILVFSNAMGVVSWGVAAVMIMATERDYRSLRSLMLHISEHSDHPFRDYTIADFAIIRSPIPRFSGQF